MKTYNAMQPADSRRIGPSLLGCRGRVSMQREHLWRIRT